MSSRIAQCTLDARRTDIGQTGHESFEVLVDPEDNEFCILGVRRA